MERRVVFDFVNVLKDECTLHQVNITMNIYMFVILNIFLSLLKGVN